MRLAVILIATCAGGSMNASAQLAPMSGPFPDSRVATQTMLTFGSGSTSASVPFGREIDLFARILVPTYPCAAATPIKSRSEHVSIAANGAAWPSAVILSSIYQGCETDEFTAGMGVGGYFPVPFGIYVISATYPGDDVLAVSTSNNVHLTVTPQFSAPTATGSGLFNAGIRQDGPLSGWFCSLTQAQMHRVGSPAAPANTPRGFDFPHGLFSYEISQCHCFSPFSAPCGSLRQDMLLEFPQPIPEGSAIWSYGRTADRHDPHWYSVPATFEGKFARLVLGDNGLGDDPAAAPDGAITGIVGIGTPSSH